MCGCVYVNVVGKRCMCETDSKLRCWVERLGETLSHVRDIKLEREKKILEVTVK